MKLFLLHQSQQTPRRSGQVSLFHLKWEKLTQGFQLMHNYSVVMQQFDKNMLLLQRVARSSTSTATRWRGSWYLEKKSAITKVLLNFKADRSDLLNIKKLKYWRFIVAEASSRRNVKELLRSNERVWAWRCKGCAVRFTEGRRLMENHGVLKIAVKTFGSAENCWVYISRYLCTCTLCLHASN